MKKIAFISLFLCFFLCHSYAKMNFGIIQAVKNKVSQLKEKQEDHLPITWIKTFENTYSVWGKSVLQTNDGGYIVAGAKEYDMWLVKIDAYGNKIWDVTYSTGVMGMGAYGNSVQQTSDGGYIVGGFGYAENEPGWESMEMLVVKFDSGGNKIWDKHFGGKYWDYGAFVKQTVDGGYIVAGSSETASGASYLLIVKTDSNGNMLWDKKFGGIEYDSGGPVVISSDGYVVAGYTNSYGAGGKDIWLVKTDFDGNKIWDKTIGGSEDEDVNSFQQTTDGGYIIISTSGLSVPECDIWLIKTDSNGNKTWDKTFGGTSFDYGYDAKQTADGGYIVLGYTQSFGKTEGDIWLIKTDSEGNKMWDKFFYNSNTEYALSVQQTVDGGYIISGSEYFGGNSHGMLLIKTDSNGNVR